MKYPKFFWNEETGNCVCHIKYNNKIFYGEAQCHSDDKDMQNRLTGEIIAELRAQINSLIYQRDCELQPQLKTLKQLYYSINQNKEFNPKSIESKAIFRAIKNTEEDLSLIREAIKELKQEIIMYIDTKDRFYQELRKRRNGQDNLTKK